MGETPKITKCTKKIQKIKEGQSGVFTAGVKVAAAISGSSFYSVKTHHDAPHFDIVRRSNNQCCDTTEICFTLLLLCQVLLEIYQFILWV